jgi:integrase
MIRAASWLCPSAAATAARSSRGVSSNGAAAAAVSAARRAVARSPSQIAAVATMWATGLSESSVVRYRASLSVFFAWCVREKIIVANPVTAVRVPKSSAETTEMLPFTKDELEEAYQQWSALDQRLADILLVLGWTGLRWSEARAARVGDVMQVPTPGLVVRRSAPEGVGTKSAKGRRSRRVPLANRILPIVTALTAGKQPGDLLLTTSRGARLHRSAVLRAVKWQQTGHGRRLYDLRHTAACLWLARGVDPGTVQEWMGHESIATTDIYLHFLGIGATAAGLERLNAARGAPGGHRAKRRANHSGETRAILAAFSQVRTGFAGGGAEGIRTPDLLIANETRYQLRHSPGSERAETVAPASTGLRIAADASAVDDLGRLDRRLSVVRRAALRVGHRLRVRPVVAGREDTVGA